MMLSSVVKEHQARQKYRKEVSERKRKEALEAADQLTRVVVQDLNNSVSQAYLNQRRIDSEAKSLHTKVTRFTHQTNQWLQLTEQFNGALKELGDVENWARSIERDMQIVNDTLTSAYELHNKSVTLKRNQAGAEANPRLPEKPPSK